MYYVAMTTSKPDLTADIEDARIHLEPLALRLRGLFQLWTIFTTAESMANAYVRDQKNLQWEAHMAFTKAVIVEYAKPWSGRNGKALKSTLDTSKNIPFLLPVTDASGTHNAMLELRNRMAAHIDEHFESIGVTFRGIAIANANPHRPQDPGTLDNVFLPVAPKMESIRGMWWIEDTAKWKEISDHISKCKIATQEQLAEEARDLRNECFDHMHVLNKMTDLILMEAISPTVNPPTAHQSYDIQSGQNLTPTINIGAPQKTKLGDQHIKAVVTIFEPSPSLPGDTEVKGRGYRLTLPEPDANGQAQWNVQFPKYPYPAEMPEKV